MNAIYSIKKILSFSLAVVVVFSAAHCAKVGSISGGPKDEAPPEFLTSKPPMNALNFKERKIRIEFDEYLQLKDVQQQFNVSPPLKKRPKVWVYNKAIIVEYSDTLKDSTTYTLSFGNSIADNNEGNVIENFEFVFSTGNYIDSMGIEGFLANAFTNKPDKEPFLIALYNNLSDTAPTSQVPMFTGRSNKFGKFAINNVKPGVYRLYAFKDGNGNFKYNPVSEAFAFYDSLVVLDPNALRGDSVFKNITDTLAGKTGPQSDSVLSGPLRPNRLRVMLNTFTEKDKTQYIKEYSRKEKRKLAFIFNNALIFDSLSLQPVYSVTENWYLPEINPGRDSLNIWITDSALFTPDTLKLRAGFWSVSQKLDTVWKTDTLDFRFVKEKEPKRKDTARVVEKMKLFSKVQGFQDLHLPVNIETEFPVLTSINTNKISLFQKVDTIEQTKTFKVERDSLYPRLFRLWHKWESQSNYRLVILPGAFENIYGLPHDTLQLRFNTQKEEAYGKYAVNITGSKGQKLVVQLLTKEIVSYQRFLIGDGKAVFDFIKPGNYILKVIFDTDGNREYTTGDFYFKRQPEKVKFFNEEINVRANWDTTIDWNLATDY